MSKVSFSITNDSVAVVVDGKSHTVRKGAANFNELRKALLDEEWDKISGLLTVASSLAQWAKGRFGLRSDEKKFTYLGEDLPEAMNNRILDMAAANEDPAPLFAFYENLQRNPSKRSVDQLWNFLSHLGIPLTPDGCFLAYKGVNENYKDIHSGTIDNSPGSTVSMPRNKISDDPDEGCHQGLHVGALEYAAGFGPRVVICKVNPEHAVCVPNDYSFQKMRVCQYEVVGHHGGTLSNTVEDWGEEEDDDWDDYEDECDDECGDDCAPDKVDFDKLNARELMELSLDTLRQYAGKGLKIVGASKIPGGKAALVGKILKVRKK